MGQRHADPTYSPSLFGMGSAKTIHYIYVTLPLGSAPMGHCPISVSFLSWLNYCILHSLYQTTITVTE